MKGKVKGTLFRIPLLKRHTEIDGTHIGGELSVMEVDGVGFFVRHKPGEKPNAVTVRRYLMGRSTIWAMIEAPTIGQAVEKFYKEWEGARVGGGQGPESFALWIDVRRPIVQFPDCTHLCRDQKGRFICGEETKDDGEWTGNGEFGGCIVEGYDAMEDGCPGSRFFRWISVFEAAYSYGNMFFDFRTLEDKVRKAMGALSE